MTPEDCNICRQSGHAKWHELSQNGVIINPVVLIQLIEKLEQTAEVMRIKNYVCYLSQITPSQIDQSAQPVAPPAEVIRQKLSLGYLQRRYRLDAVNAMKLQDDLSHFAAYLAQAPAPQGKDQGAGLIGQVAADMAGTEPRPNSKESGE